MVHFMLIIIGSGISEIVIDTSGWYLDRLIIFFLILVIQWLLLGKKIPLHWWLSSIVWAMIGWFVLVRITDPLVNQLIRKPFYTSISSLIVTRHDMLIDYFILRILFGFSLGMSQAFFLKKAKVSNRWWLVMTTVGYGGTTLCWYYATS